MDEKVLKWKIPKGFEELPEVVNRNEYTETLARMNANTLSKKCLSINLNELRALFSYCKKRLPIGYLRGVGVDLGAGTALLSAVAIEQFKSIEKIYAIEIVDGYPTKVIPNVSNEILGKNHHKIVPVIGSFDEIELPDSSVDFAIEIHSLHHSHDLNQTLREVYRVLKPGGIVVCFDRSHPDSLTEKERIKMLDIVYNEEFLAYHGYPTGIKLTRRDNGEHEHRLSEWKRYFYDNGFMINSISYASEPIQWRSLLVHSFSLLPNWLNKLFLGSKSARLKKASFDRELCKIPGFITGNHRRFKRNYAIFIVRKQ